MQTRINLTVKLDVFNDENLFSDLRAEWNDLVHRSISDMIFLTWEWQSTWWRAYQPGELWVLTVRDENEKLVGIAPWFISHEDGKRVVRCIGCEDVTDYLDVIVDENHVEDVFHCLADHLAANRQQFNKINLCNIPENSITRTSFAESLSLCGFDVSETQLEVCPIIQLPQSWDEYLGNLNKKQRHEIRRKMRRINGAPGEVDWFFITSDADIDSELEKFLQLMAASDPEKAKFLEDSQHVEFFKNFVQIAHERGWLELSFLIIGGQPAAAYLNFIYRNQVLVYNSGLNFVDFGEFSPGIVLLGHLIRDAIENERSVFDFLRGNETYKYRMGAIDTGVFSLQAQ